jgi:hypothetical protein
MKCAVNVLHWTMTANLAVIKNKIVFLLVYFVCKQSLEQVNRLTNKQSIQYGVHQVSIH